MPVNGQMVKNGGNVVSYFCTPEGRLIHAVGGPVDADRLLTEASWAMEVFKNMQMEVRRSKADVLREAHRSASTQSHSWQPGNGSWKKRSSAGQTRLHSLLVNYAYMPMTQVETTLFRKLSGENFEMDRTAILEAARGFANAEKRKRPVLLVLESKPRGHFNQQTHSQKRAMDHHLKNYQSRRYLRRFNVVRVPKIQLAAFTNLKELTGWGRFKSDDSSWRYRDACLLVHPSGKILSQLDLHDSDDFAAQLKTALEIWDKELNSEDHLNSI